MIPGKMVPGMGGAMDLVTGAKRVIIAMQHTAKGKPKVVKKCGLPLTSVRPVDLLVSEMAVIAFPDGQATLLETGPGVTVAQIVAATEAELVALTKSQKCSCDRQIAQGGMSMTAAGASWSNGCNRHFEIAEDRSTQDGLWLGSLEGVGVRTADVRFGSKADICSAKRHVRFTLESGHVRCS